MNDFDEYMNHVIDIEFYAEARAMYVKKRLLLLKQKLLRILDKNTTLGDKKKFKETLKNLDEVTDSELDNLEEELKQERKEYLEKEDKFLRGLFSASALATTFLSILAARKILNVKFNSKDNFKSFSKNLKDNIKSAYKNPLNTENHFGGSTSHAAETVSRNIDRLITHAESDTKTMTTALQRDTHRYITKQSGYKLQYVAMLDSRTCPVCGINHGKVFDEDDAPVVPVHNNCRCVLVHVKGDGYSLRDYDTWLRSQPDYVQEKILGKTRFSMYKAGYISKVNQFTSKGRMLTLDELYKKKYLDFSGGKYINKEAECLRQEEHANAYYEFIRNRKPTDVSKISKNTKLSADMIKAVRSHVFTEKHDLYKGFNYFDADPEIAHAWQRLEQNTFTENDILLLKHEYEELTLIKTKGYNIDKAHVFATAKYPWEYKLLGWSDDRIMADVNERLKIYL